MGETIKSYKDLRVFQNAMDAAMEIFELTKGFPSEEKYSMVDQIRRAYDRESPASPAFLAAVRR